MLFDGKWQVLAEEFAIFKIKLKKLTFGTKTDLVSLF